MSDLQDLIARVEAGEGADRGLDADIELALGNWTPEHHEAWNVWQECGEALPGTRLSVPADPRWLTTSLDAVMALVPEGWCWAVEGFDDTRMAVGLLYQQPRPLFQARATSPARALLAAILRAKAGV